MPVAKGYKSGEMLLGEVIRTCYIEYTIIGCNCWWLNPQLFPEYFSEGASESDVISCFIHQVADFTGWRIHNPFPQQVGSTLHSSMYQ
jgi:hypothetical protein